MPAIYEVRLCTDFGVGWRCLCLSYLEVWPLCFDPHIPIFQEQAWRQTWPYGHATTSHDGHCCW